MDLLWEKKVGGYPVYDVNPSIYGDTLSLNVDSDSNLIDFNLALSVASLFDLSEAQAAGELKEIKYAWKIIGESLPDSLD